MTIGADRPDALQWMPGAPARLEGPPLAIVPRLSLEISSVLVGPFTDARSRAGLDQATHGSGGPTSVGSEELRFAPETGALAGLLLPVPEEDLSYWDQVEPWLAVEPVESGLRTGRSEWAEVPQATQYLFEAGTLAGVRLGPWPPPRPRAAVRVRVAPDLELLFGDGAYRGWMLHRAAHHLVRSWEPSPSTEPEADLPRLLAEYLRLTDKHSRRLLVGADPAHRGRMEALRRRLASKKEAASPQREALRGRVEDLLARYFP